MVGGKLLRNMMIATFCESVGSAPVDFPASGISPCKLLLLNMLGKSKKCVDTPVPAQFLQDMMFAT
jgi:hypothetical protein